MAKERKDERIGRKEDRKGETEKERKMKRRRKGKKNPVFLGESF